MKTVYSVLHDSIIMLSSLFVKRFFRYFSIFYIFFLNFQALLYSRLWDRLFHAVSFLFIIYIIYAQKRERAGIFFKPRSIPRSRCRFTPLFAIRSPFCHLTDTNRRSRNPPSTPVAKKSSLDLSFSSSQAITAVSVITAFATISAVSAIFTFNLPSLSFLYS